MSYESYEESLFHGEPVELLLFIYGTGPNDFVAYTDCEIPITHENRTYLPFPLERDAINSSGTLDKSGLNLRVDGNSAIAELFRVYPPSQTVSLIIKTGHIGDPDADFKVIWTGRVLSCGWEENIATLTCEPVASSMLRTGLRRHYQYGCPHALYMGNEEGGCRASKVAATRTSTVVSVTGSLLSLPSGWNGPRPKQKFINGLIEWTAPGGSVIRRSILRINDSTNVITMGGPIPALSAGATVAVILGCNHQMTDCAELHNNINDFGGQPWIPTKTPFGNTQNFY